MPHEMDCRNYNAKSVALRNCVCDSTVGYYLYVYENGVDICDHLHDTLEISKEVAFKWYNVPMDAWREVDEA